MYKDLITYELAEGVTQEHLLKIAEQIVNDWMKNQPGFIKWEINLNNDGSYTDIVYWETMEDAKAAEKTMMSIPNGAEWYGCYKKGSIKGVGTTTVTSF